jgi:hypothetical protein
MLGILLTICGLAVIGIVGPLVAMASESKTYGTELENYIVSNNPKDTGDVERLTREYDLASSKRFL